MGLFGLFGKSPKQREEEASMRRAEAEDLEIYSGMRVEVTSNDGRIFLAAKLTSLRGDRAQLLPLTEGNLLTRTEEPIPVMIRGFSSRENKADVIAYLLGKTAGAGHVLMIGDTDYDVLGAAAHGIPTIGVSWGYGDVHSMEAAGALAVVDTPQALYTQVCAGISRQK